MLAGSPQGAASASRRRTRASMASNRAVAELHKHEGTSRGGGVTEAAAAALAEVRARCWATRRLARATLPRGRTIRRRSGAARAYLWMSSGACHACSGTAVFTKGMRVPGWKPDASKRLVWRVPARIGWHARFSPTTASVEYCPQVEHHVVSSDNHLVWGRPELVPSGSSAAAARAHRSAADFAQRLPATALQEELDTLQRRHRHPCADSRRRCPPRLYGLA